MMGLYNFMRDLYLKAKDQGGRIIRPPSWWYASIHIYRFRSLMMNGGWIEIEDFNYCDDDGYCISDKLSKVCKQLDTRFGTDRRVFLTSLVV